MTFVIPKSYFDPSKPNLQRVINPKSAKILDMGCGAGTLGQALKQKLNAEVWGVESNFSLVNYAKNKLDKVISSGIEDSVSSLPDNYFDTIIFKSLDHSTHPYSLLTAIKRKLVPGGEVIASITNVLQWPVLRNLMEGFWKYDYYGVMDKNHLRFFTLRSIVELFRNSGYYISSINAEPLPESQVPEGVMLALSKTDLDPSALKKESGIYEYLVKGVKPSTEKGRLHNNAESLLKAGKYELAKDIYTSLYTDTPYSTETVFGLALCSRGLKDHKSTLKYLGDLLELQPEHSGAYNQIGIFHLERGDLQKARSMFIESILKLPKSSEAKYNYAKTLFKLENCHYSLLVLENILESKPDDLKTILLVSRIYKQSGNTQKAIHFARRALELDAACRETDELLKVFKKASVPVSENNSTGYHEKQVSIEPVPTIAENGLTRNNISNANMQCLAPDIGRYFINSIPKGGTNLLKKVVSLFPGIDNSQINIGKPDKLEDLPIGNLGTIGGRGGYLGKPSEWNSHIKVPIGVDWPIMEDIEKIFFILTMLENGKFAMGHIPYSEDLSNLLSKMQIKTFLILRDPRDVVVSHAFFVSTRPYNTCYELYRHLSPHEQIMASIVGINEDEGFGIKLLNIKERIEALLPWMSNDNNCTVLFEKLVGPQGSGSLDLQIQELKKISLHLGFEKSSQEIENLTSNIFGETESFRKGTIGDWKTFMTEEHKDVCKDLIGQILIDLGYEKDFKW